MSNKVLFIFEGEKTEEQIISNLQTLFMNVNTTVTCVFGAEIYQIYREIEADDDLDTFNLIKERNDNNRTVLGKYNRSDFAEIYLFFDYDGHSTLAYDKKLEELLVFFNEETNKGKLYVSYPMVEALKHICDYGTFETLTVDCKFNIRYKKIVHDSALSELKNIKKYDMDIWKRLVDMHVKKGNLIVNDEFTFPVDLISQQTIFLKQLEKFINPSSKVAVLSAFPIFLLDYYGNEEMKRHLI